MSNALVSSISVVTLPIQYTSKPVRTWNSPMNFNRVSHEEAIYRT